MFGRLTPRLPSNEGRTVSHALTDTGDTRLGRETASRVAAHRSLTGVHLLRDGKEAFAARVLLARAAERSLDVQYYIWHHDLSSCLLMAELRAAANRGVRVRLLLDDNGVGGLDETLADLNDHANVEVRLFNPFAIRKPRHLNYVFDFRRLNHRMHNKSFTADNRATIVGGRNVGDEYFGAREDGLFADLDALCLGEIVPHVSTDFDRYWASQSAYPAERILAPVTPERKAAIEIEEVEIAESEKARHYREAVRALPLFNDIADGEVPFEWASVRLLSDPPDKARGRAPLRRLLAARLLDALGEPQRQLSIISGYFVPGDAGTQALVDMARSGVEVRVLTNSYAATDVGFVHAGYANRRKPLVRAGVALFEMPAPDDEPKTASKFLRSGGGRGRSLREAGTTLHSKAFAVDDERMFVGSFNFDPRSFHLNTEIGLVIECPTLAKAMRESFTEEVAPSTYRVCLSNDGDLAWRDERDDRPRDELTEPGTTWWSRALIRLLARLPIEWLL